TNPDGPAGAVGFNCALAVESTGRLHMAWNRGNNNLYYAKENAPGSWTGLIQVEAGNNPTGIAMVLDSSNFPQIAYESAVTGWPRYIYFNGSSWSSGVW